MARLRREQVHAAHVGRGGRRRLRDEHGDFFCLASTPGKQIEVTEADKAAGGLWLACSRSHCLTSGVKLAVNIVTERVAERASGARKIVVPAWTDDFGFCSSLGARFDDGVHRPHGLTSIWAFEGDTHVEVQSHHNVWRAPDYATARALRNRKNDIRNSAGPTWAEAARTTTIIWGPGGAETRLGRGSTFSPMSG